MTEITDATAPTHSAPRRPSADPGNDNAPKRRFGFGFDRFSGLYVIGVLVVLFSVLLPQTFPTVNTLKSLGDQEAITALLAIALIIPMAAGAFDLSVASQLALSVVIVAWMQTNGFDPVASVLTALVVGALIGALNGLIVVRLRVNSFVATLGMSSLLTGAAFWVTGGKPIVSGLSPDFLAWGRNQPLGIPLPFIYLLVVAALVWYVLGHTPVGRYLYSAGSNPQAARLAGVKVDRLVFGSLVASSTIAAFAGIVLVAKLGVGNHEVGASYLLPVFAAAFLGATQIIPGRVNVIGTLVAVFLLAIGVKGLQLLGAPDFVNDLFNGAALIVAVSLAAARTRRRSS
jgi:ribose transport system permease protein